MRFSPLETQPRVIETERLTLAPLGTEHADALFAVLQDREVYRFVPDEAPRHANVLAQRYRRTSAGPTAQNERWWNWAVATHEQPDSPFGTVETSLSENGRHASIGYLFGRTVWGRGFAFEACRAVIAYLREHAGAVRIDAFVDTRNERSIRLAERLDMQRIDIIAGADHFKDSASDEIHFRLFTTEQKEDDG